MKHEQKNTAKSILKYEDYFMSQLKDVKFEDQYKQSRNKNKQEEHPTPINPIKQI